MSCENVFDTCSSALESSTDTTKISQSMGDKFSSNPPAKTVEVISVSNEKAEEQLKVFILYIVLF